MRDVNNDTGAPGEGSIAAIVLAAGASSRMGGVDKIWAPLDGAPVIAHAIRACVEAIEGLSDLVLVAPAARHADLRALAGETAVTVHYVEGGRRRQDSVAHGIAAVPDAGWYLVHDGARPLVTAEVIARVVTAARCSGAAIPGVPVTDTVKRVDAQGLSVETPDRATLRAVQTPQAFAGPLLRRAHAEVTQDVTDDAAMVEVLGQTVVVTPGDPENLKITTALDLHIARLLLARRRGEWTE